MIASGAKKRFFLQNSALLGPKRVLGAFCRFDRQKSEKKILGDFGLQQRAQMLIFKGFGARGEKYDFL